MLAPHAGLADGGPDWAGDAVGYQIFVRSFQDSNDDGVGDLRGLVSRMDALNDGDPTTDRDLGVDVLWLTPFTRSAAYHGYEVLDHHTIDPVYGSMHDFSALVSAAHARGMRVVLDLVLNHTASLHPWFEDAASGPDARFRSYYVWRDRDPGWTKPWNQNSPWYELKGSWYYALFWPGMPDLNYDNLEVHRAMIDIAHAWLDRGVDGLRLDAVRYLAETGPGAGQADATMTHVFLRSLRRSLALRKPEPFLLGEVWTDTKSIIPYFGTSKDPELHQAFDFDTAKEITAAIRSGDARPLRRALASRLERTPPWATVGTFLANHDQSRIGTSLAELGPSALRLAASVLLTLPGTPWLYYGEEIGMIEGGRDASHEEGDRARRRPMQWTGGKAAGFSTRTPWLAPASTDVADSVEGQTNREDSLLSLYRRLIRLRRAHPALRKGKTILLPSSEDLDETEIRKKETNSHTVPPPQSLFAMLRTQGRDAVLVAYNFAESPAPLVVPRHVFRSDLRVRDALSSDHRDVVRLGDGQRVSVGLVPARGCVVLEVPQQVRRARRKAP